MFGKSVCSAALSSAAAPTCGRCLCHVCTYGDMTRACTLLEPADGPATQKQAMEKL